MKIKHHHLSAFSLVEVTMALAVTAFCLVIVFGLLPVGINSNQNSVRQTVAANLARAVISDLRATQNTTPSTTTSTMLQIPIPAPGANTNLISTIFLREDGSVAQSSSPTTVNVNADPAQNPWYRATLYFNPPATGQRASTRLHILVTWPALADPIAANTPGAFTGSYETFTTLDRN
jgi:type II secretory pathway pseudopilin PulG